MNLKQAYSYSVQFLEGNGVDEADFKALCVSCRVAGIRNSEYLAHINDDIIHSRLAKMLMRLKDGEPLQYVLGKWDFYESEFYVGEGVLIPRPETEELVERCLRALDSSAKPVIYDLCSGSGCIGISLAKKLENATVYCVEKSEKAFQYLEKNAKGIPNVKTVLADINSCPELPQADVIVSNPPYIKTEALKSLQSEVQREPSMALDGGADGLTFYRIINDKYAKRLNDNGLLFLEIGNEQGEAVKKLLTSFKSVEVHKDIYKNDRIVTGVKA